MKRKYIILIGLIAVIACNILLTYVLMWNPYSLYFDRPEFSETHFETRDNLALIAVIVNFTLLWGTVIWALFDWKRRNRLSVVALIFSGLTFWILMEVQDYYPDAESEWTENGYKIKIQKWYLDGDKSYKRWKSQDSHMNYENHREVVWELDSISKD